jgi:hypothetical protein
MKLLEHLFLFLQNNGDHKVARFMAAGGGGGYFVTEGDFVHFLVKVGMAVVIAVMCYIATFFVGLFIKVQLRRLCKKYNKFCKGVIKSDLE